MKFVKAILLLSFSLLLTTAFAQNKTVPDVTLKTLEGASKNIQDFAKNDKITVISFWATWCAPCKKELDAISKVYKEWQATYDMELVAVSIDTRRAIAKVPSMVASKGWEYTVLTGKATELQDAFDFQTIPQTFLLDQKGNIVYHHNGYVAGDELELENKIKALAGK